MLAILRSLINFVLQSTFNMDNQQEQLEALQEIRGIMDRTSRFISLSGLSGIAAGVSALIGAAAVQNYLNKYSISYSDTGGTILSNEANFFLISLTFIVFMLALSSACYFTLRNAHKSKQKVWNNQTERMLINLFIPIAAGGIFCAILLYHHLLYLIAPVMLVFYGLALLNASKYTLSDIRYLGMLEILLGLSAGFFVQYGLLTWTIGFGLLHIVYGTLVYFKYEHQ